MISRAAWPFAVNWQSPQARHLVAWYPVLPFERDAKLRDLTPNRRHVTTVGGAPVLVGSSLRPMPGLLCDGTDDYVQLGPLSTFVTASSAAWSCWVTPMAASYKLSGNAYDLNHILGDSGGYIGLVIGNLSSGGQKIHAYNNAQVATAIATYTQYRPYHVLLGHVGGTLYLYLDGVLQQTNASGDTGSVGGSLRVGHGYGGYAHIEVSDVRVYSALPNPLAIEQMYDPDTRWELYQRPRAIAWFGGVIGGSGNTYTLSTALAAGAALSDSAALTLSATVPLQAQGSVVDAQNASMPAASTLAVQAALAQTGTLVLALQEALGVVAGAVAVGGPAYTQSLALSLSAALTASRSLLLSPAVSLPASALLALSPQLTLPAATVLAASAVFAPTGSLVAPMVASLSAAAALAAQETSTVVVATSLTITAQATLATQAQQLHATLLTLGVEAATAAQAAAIYQQACTLALAAALQAQDVIFEPAVIQALWIAGEQLQQSVVEAETLATARITNETLI